MPDPTELEMKFRAPQDVKLPEVALLTKSISDLYETVESISARQHAASTRDRESYWLGRKLVIKELRYGSDLRIILLAASTAIMQVPVFINAVRELRDRERQRVARERLENKEATERSLRRLMREREGEELRRAVSALADELGIDTNELLDRVDPVLESIYQSRIAFSLDDSPYR